MCEPFRTLGQCDKSVSRDLLLNLTRNTHTAIFPVSSSLLREGTNYFGSSISVIARK